MFTDDTTWLCLPSQLSQCQPCIGRQRRSQNGRHVNGAYREMADQEALVHGVDVTWQGGDKRPLCTLSNGTATGHDFVSVVEPAAMNSVAEQNHEGGDEGIGMCCHGEITTIITNGDDTGDNNNDAGRAGDDDCDADSGCSSSLLSPPPGPLFINVADDLMFSGKFPVSPNSPEQDEFCIDRGSLIRSSSLRTAKTPPGTPSRKKAVRFADAMGLDLESVRHILKGDGPPKIPGRVMDSYRSAADEPASGPLLNFDLLMPAKYLAASFSQPGASFGFLDRVQEKKVCLENCIVMERTASVTIRVANIAFHKAVLIKYTMDGWATSRESNATYITGSCDGPSDRFTFSLSAPPGFPVGSKIEFCIQYIANDQFYWDNNYGVNYQIECYASQVGKGLDPSLMHF
ncbi:PREDICTED: protein phosphatase 1 regulatory subunit 3B-like [Priapulus caudatus]|uniref:Protein phosphatase 1 regulatory subunit 3B-like n=1 Tax=Priapulus caudatus TaxID=37621 RepID=A0ABM1ECL9_PRICU|nr:PREDICTED: protein phosphatase 1 regulatory subunit 3B-like [Priapulus caudatus]